LRELGVRAERAAPPFARLWRAAQAQAAAPGRRRLSIRSRIPAIALTAAFVAAVAFFTAWRDRHTGAPPPMIAQWRSPTDFLLATPRDGWLGRAPRIDESAVALPRARSTPPEETP
jgi:hypothetical protein